MSLSVAGGGFALWFTGLPCAGKTTLANAVGKELRRHGLQVEELDGDVMRQRLSPPPGFTKKARMAHIARLTGEAERLTRDGAAVLVSVISPYRRMREDARRRIHPFIEVYVRCPLSVCEERDVKGMYRLARQGKIKNFTGITGPYEEPLSPEIAVDTDRMSLESCLRQIIEYLDLFPAPEEQRDTRKVTEPIGV